MKKVISYCIWGKKKIYNYGIYEIAISLPRYFPGWNIVVYHTKTVNYDVIRELQKIPYVECIEVNFPNHYRNSMIRFLAAFNPNNDVVIFRDADSRLLKRDVIAVEEWLKSGKEVHVMRDCPTNGKIYRMSAGMWGVRNKFLLKKEILDAYADHFANYENCYRIDEIFLFKYVYPLLNEKNSIIHSEYYKYEPWSTKFPSWAPMGRYDYVGKTYYNTPNASKKFNDSVVRQGK